MKNSEENRTTDFEKKCNVKVSLANFELVSIADCNLTQNGFVTNGAKTFTPEKVHSQKSNCGFPA